MGTSDNVDWGAAKRRLQLVRIRIEAVRLSATLRVVLLMRLLLTAICMSAESNRTRMVPRGLEPRTLRLLAVRSNQLSYETK